MGASTFIPGILTDRPQPVDEHAPALECGNVGVSYGQLSRRVRALAAEFARRGVAPGSRVAVAARRDIETHVAMLALLALGAAYVPLDLGYPRARIEAMLESAGAAFVAGTRAALARLPGSAARELALDDIDSCATPVELPHVEAGRLAYILFTSGSTGTPKGVAMPRAPLARLIGWHQTQPRLSRPARTLAFAPISFDVHFQELHSTLATGGCLVSIDESARRDPDKLLDALDTHRIERLFLPYVALQMLAEAVQSSGRAPAALANVVSAGETLRITPAIRELFRGLPGARLHNHYGPTEAHVVSSLQLDDDPESWPELPSIGAPLPHVKLALSKPADAPDVPADQGELLIGGACLADGYLERDRLTAQRFPENPRGLAGRWFATGDLARRDAEGNWHCLGRIDAQTKVDGFRVEPAELEVALLGLRGVRAAVVDVRELAALGRQLVAWVVPAGGVDAATLAGRLRNELRGVLPTQLQPARIHAVAALPRTPSGKIDLKALPVPDAPINIGSSPDPLTRVTRAWAQLLGRRDIDPDANVFELGAGSLGVVRLLTLLKAHGDTGLGVADVYAAPTPRGQAAHLTGNDHGAAALDAARRRGARQRAAFARMRPDLRSHHA